ncbi:MAG: ABC transporter permease, partial [Sphingobacteriia bacterium]
MNYRLLFSIARTHLLQRPKQTILAALGVTFGIGMYIFMISFMGGLNRFLDNITIENTPDIRIYYELESDRPPILAGSSQGRNIILHHQRPKQEKENLKNGLLMLELVQAHPLVRVAAAKTGTQAFFSYGSQELSGNLEGIQPEAEAALYTLDYKIKEGNIRNLRPGENDVILGEGMAKLLSLRVGDRVVVTTPAGNRLRMQVVGLLNTGVKSVDDTRAYTSLATVQKLLGESSTYITDISMRLKDREQADAIAMAFARQFGYKAESWREANKQYETGSKIRSIIGYAVSITLLVVAGFGIFNILSMSIQEKMKDIAILKAMGFSRRDVLGIFLIEAITIGVLGGTAGLILGFSFSYVISITTFTAGQM